MRSVSPRRARGHLQRTLIAAVVTAVLALTGAASAAVATTAAPDQTVSVDGMLVNLVVEQPEGQVSMDAELEVRTAVEVDGDLYEIPAGTPVAAGVTGDEVTVTIEADADLSVAEALDIATESPDANDVESGAQVVAVSPVGEATTGETSTVLADGVVGTHTLTVLPVYWGSTDGTSQATLASLASTTAQYWAAQSGGGISVQASARAWAPIADPETCNTDAIFSRALAAHGVAAPTSTTHVLVYFPERGDCGGWAGRASIGSGYIWVNGTPLPDVFAHEFGHNLGLGHANRATCTAGTRVPLVVPMGGACAVNEYYDRADVMGIATSSASGNLNTALADYLGLVNVQRISSGGSATVDLAPLASTGALRSVAVAVSGGTVYVDFRPATGRDVRMPAWAGVQVHYRTLDGQYGYPTSYLLDMKAPAASAFTSPAFPAGTSWAVPGTTQTITVDSVGSTARVRVSQGQSVATTPGQSAVTAYITSVYNDLFSRQVDPSGLSTWSAALQAGTPRVAVANAITYSTEYRSRLIAGSYSTYLGRSPDAGGLAHWLRMMAQGMTIQQMEAGFLASPEYYALAGSSDARWVQRLYQHVLGRSAGSSEVTHWVAMLARGWTRDGVALGFLISTEHLTTVVDGYYVALLGRHIDPSGRATWVTKIQTGSRVEEIIGGIVASDEYFSNV